MMLYVKTLFFLACLCLTASAQAQDKPEFCGDLECPAFSSVSNDGYELRTYTDATAWVGSTVTTNRWMVWFYQYSLFQKLYRYISGSNSEGINIDMTVPVLMKYEDLGNGKIQYTMLFYLAVPNPPQPNDGSVFLQTVPENTSFFVKSFSTTLLTPPWTYRNKLGELKSSINNPEAYEANVHYRVGYNEPTDFNKHNEVWLEAL